ncbi:acyl carrier protein [Kitasatospora azatica]|uniref:acyl carrier protein n=1 Tax=Kitasatospora azatica TaxID=58347 RepID=UPI000691F167|nr:acyl carrier protein [Kitasatospora azatica]
MTSPTDPEEIVQWLTGRLAELLEMPVADIDVTVPLDALGVTSMEEAVITGDLEARYGLVVPVADLRRHPTVESLGSYLADLTPAASGPSALR